MMKRFLLLAVMLVVAACATDPGTRHDQKQTGAVVAGAVIGGLIGAQFGGGSGSVALAAAGAVAGGWVGNRIFQRTASSEYERDAFRRALNDAPSGQRVTWSDSRTGESGFITPTNTRRMSDGRLCRDFHRGLTIGGQSVDDTRGTACRTSNGNWDAA